MRRLVFIIAAVSPAIGLIVSAYLSFETNTSNEFNFIIALAGIYLAILVPLGASYYGQPDFEIRIGDPIIEPSGKYLLLKADVVSKRNFLRDPRPLVTFYDGNNTYTITGKWDSQPVPLLVMPKEMGGYKNFQGWLTRVERTVDILPGRKEALAFALKREGEQGFYGFDSWNYSDDDLKHMFAKIYDLKPVKVKIEVRVGDITKTKWFVIENRSTKIMGFNLRELKKGESKSPRMDG